MDDQVVLLENHHHYHHHHHHHLHHQGCCWKRWVRDAWHCTDVEEALRQIQESRSVPTLFRSVLIMIMIMMMAMVMTILMRDIEQDCASAYPLLVVCFTRGHSCTVADIWSCNLLSQSTWFPSALPTYYPLSAREWWRVLAITCSPEPGERGPGTVRCILTIWSGSPPKPRKKNKWVGKPGTVRYITLRLPNLYWLSRYNQDWPGTRILLFRNRPDWPCMLQLVLMLINFFFFQRKLFRGGAGGEGVAGDGDSPRFVLFQTQRQRHICNKISSPCSSHNMSYSPCFFLLL